MVFLCIIYQLLINGAWAGVYEYLTSLVVYVIGFSHFTERSL